MSQQAQTPATPLLKSPPEQKEGRTQVILRDQFAFGRDRSPVYATLTTRTLTVESVDGSRSIYKLYQTDDIVGGTVGTNSLSVHSYPFTTESCSSTPQRVHVETVLHSSDAALLRQWHLRIQQVAYHAPMDDKMPQRNIYILINPASGAGKASKRYQECEQLFKHSGANVTVRPTERAGHAFEIAQQLDYKAYDIVATVSGDGLLHEVVNGLFSRPDWKEAVSALSVGTIGGGSGNGLASAVLAASEEPLSVLSSALLLVKGASRKVDIFSVLQEGERPRFGFLSLAWALISDIDLESETWRCCGGARFTWTALLRLCCLRSYRAQLSYLPAPPERIAWKPQTPAEICRTPHHHGQRGQHLHYAQCRAGQCSHCCGDDESGKGEMNVMEGYLRARNVLDLLTGAEKKEKEKSAEEERKEAEQAKQEGKAEEGQTEAEAEAGAAAEGKKEEEDKGLRVSLSGEAAYTEPPADAWISAEDDWTAVWGMNVTHAASDMHTAPAAHWSDGCMDLSIMRRAEVDCCSMTGLFLGIENGEHLHNTILNYVKVRGVRLTPVPGGEGRKESQIVIDGERVPYKPVELRVWRGVLNLICREQEMAEAKPPVGLSADEVGVYTEALRTDRATLLNLANRLRDARSAWDVTNRKGILMFRCHQTLWLRDKAMAAWFRAPLPVLKYSKLHAGLADPSFLTFLLRLLCTRSRRATPLAIDLTKHPDLKLSEDETVLLGNRVVQALAANCMTSTPEAARTFVASGSWDAAIHLVLFPPEQDLLDRLVGTVKDRVLHVTEGALTEHWALLWHSLASAARDEAGRRALKALCKVPFEGEYKFPYRFPGDGSSSAAAIALIKAETMGALALDVAAVVALHGSLCDANAAGRFLDSYLRSPLPGEVQQKVLSGELTPRCYKRLQSLRSFPLDSLPFVGGEPVPNETREDRFTLLCGLAHFLSEAISYMVFNLHVCEEGKTLFGRDFVEILLSMCLCAGSIRSNYQLSWLAKIAQVFVGLCILPAGKEILCRRVWTFPGCLHPACPKHSAAFHRECSAIPAAPGFLLPFLVGALLRAWAAGAPGSSGNTINNQGELLFQLACTALELHRAASSKRIELLPPDVLSVRELTEAEARALALPGQKEPPFPGTGIEVGFERKAVDIARAWAKGLGLDPALVADKLRNVPDHAQGGMDLSKLNHGGKPTSQCANPACKAQAVEKRCARCRRARYCSRECQTAHWPTHKEACKALAKAVAKTGGAGPGA